MLYHAYQLQTDWIGPLQRAAEYGAALLNHPPFGTLQTPATRSLAAAWEVFSRLRLTHQRPSFGIDAVQVGDRRVPVHEQAVLRTPFCTLQRFVRDDLGDAIDTDRPKVLIVAPLSGHFATLLNDTARTMLADHDVYISDWHNAREVPLYEGRFGLDEYVEHVIRFMFYVAEEARELMSQLGFSTVEEMVGRVDRIRPRDVNEHFKAKKLDTSALLVSAECAAGVGVCKSLDQDHGLERSLDHQLLPEVRAAIEQRERVPSSRSRRRGRRRFRATSRSRCIPTTRATRPSWAARCAGRSDLRPSCRSSPTRRWTRNLAPARSRSRRPTTRSTTRWACATSCRSSTCSRQTGR